ncbi:MAG: glycosyltransferase [Nitrospirae bacterium]|nr:glycosyltransferase [Nitrospirota bacterium]
MLKQPIRVLQSVGSLNRGGIETWLMNILRQRSEELQIDFILGMPNGAYEDEAKKYGCRIYYHPVRSRVQKRLDMVGLGKAPHFLKRVLGENNYDVFHVHGDEFFGDAMKEAAAAGVPVRVAHCHNTQIARGKKGIEMQVRRWRFKTWDRFLTLRNATDIVACSSDAGQHFMGRHWKSDPRCKPIYCGVPTDQFGCSKDRWTRQEFRKMFGIPEDAVVIGHVGSMDLTPQKNHALLLQIFRELAGRDERYILCLAGDGPRRPYLKEEAESLGLDNRVLLPGLCDDVPSLMVHGFDVHLLPSLFEGLPVVGLEAVASGLCTVCSDTITRDYTEYFSGRVITVPLTAPPSVWADSVEMAIRKRIAVAEGTALVRNSPFSIESSLNNLVDTYKKRLAVT